MAKHIQKHMNVRDGWCPVNLFLSLFTFRLICVFLAAGKILKKGSQFVL